MGNTSTFNYADFINNYDSLRTLVGIVEESDNKEAIGTSIGDVISICNSKINGRLAYAEESVWASRKIEEWNELYPKLTKTYNDVANLLKAARAAAEEYSGFENK